MGGTKSFKRNLEGEGELMSCSGPAGRARKNIPPAERVNFTHLDLQPREPPSWLNHSQLVRMDRPLWFGVHRHRAARGHHQRQDPIPGRTGP